MKRYSSYFKLLGALALVWFVYQFIDYKELEEVLKRLSPLSLFMFILIYLVGQLLSSVKWWLILNNAGSTLTWTKALRAYFAGMFVNSYGLGVVGGDVARGVLASGHGLTRSQAFASVLADRVHGLSVLSVLGLCAILVGHFSDTNFWIFLILLCVTFGGILGWLFGPPILLKVCKKSPRLLRIAEAIILVFPRRFGFLAVVTLLSLFFHLSQIFLFWLIAIDIGVMLPVVDVLSYVPVVNILCTLPLSWNGLGVRENANFYFFNAHLSAEEAASIGAIWLLAVLLCAAVGGLIGVFGPELKTIRADLDTRQKR